MNTPKLLSISSLCLLLVQTPVYSAKLFKWVDEDGQIRYSDSLPAGQSTKRHQTLSKDGRIVDTKEAAIPAEQLARERAEKKRQEEEEKLSAEKIAQKKAIKDHHDNVLLMTFSNDSEILEAQDERLEVIDSVIQLLRKNIKNEELKLEKFERRAQEVYISKDKVVPGGLAQNIEYFGEKILGIQKQLELKILERAKIKEQYVIDLIRYRELTQNEEDTPDKPNL